MFVYIYLQRGILSVVHLICGRRKTSASMPAALIIAALARSSRCPPGHTVMATNMSYTPPRDRHPVTLLVCEQFRADGNGEVMFIPDETVVGFPLTLKKQVARNTPIGNNDTAYGNWSKSEVLVATTDVLGNELLGCVSPPKHPLSLVGFLCTAAVQRCQGLTNVPSLGSMGSENSPTNRLCRKWLP